ncbi:NADH dehydrogenase [ubiquinone] 1 alpha subcomplex assembly factor 3 [Cyprinus carpio]|uniref:NADH dehydrogenase [ubiquinone] 1 alpha subcomplex assembly factor 3 n=2 Tax=Cyprinus carpio TaxID=7962 RepID=A0A8C1UIG3_CYPCA|nr:NADH dehydrogenase [ubiquinone] 1 alpha subcomplex assembly factor 3 [Cyprinus carpio]
MAAVSCARLLSPGSVHGLRLGSRLLPALSRVSLVRCHRLGPADDELYQRTTVTLLQKEAAGGAVIYSYSPRGFNISGNKVLGPCAVLPPAVLQWNVGHHTDITVESLSLFYLLEPRIEILVLGTGARTERLDPNVLDFLKKKGIAVEVQDTPNACATFNFLSSERRLAAAGLIPPPAAE